MLIPFRWVHDTGSVYTQFNRPGWGLGIDPYWLDAGQTHGGPGVALGLTGLRDNIKLAHIYGSNRLDVTILDPPIFFHI